MIRNSSEAEDFVMSVIRDERCYDLHETNNFDYISLIIKIL